ncbi:MAG: DUF1513 domain-containing protein [Pseudomonadota bacterium]
MTNGRAGGLSRRAVLAGGAASLIPFRAAGANEALFLAGCRLSDGQDAAALFDGAGAIVAVSPIDARGHGGAVSPDRRVGVLFARRPGQFAVVFDLNARRRVGAFAPPAERRFAGHGAFSADGRLLYATENDFEAERGVVGVYDVAAGYRRVGEFATHGVGPHEMLLMRDGETLAVANGGIATHPDFPRMKLNLPFMEPSLALIRASDGELLARAALPERLHKLSIRHIAEAGGAEIWLGMQFEGPPDERVPLVGRFHRDRGIVLNEGWGGAYARLDQYVGSVAASRDGATVVTTSPRGGVALEWDVATRRLRAEHRLADVSGVAAHGPAGFILTTGRGLIAPAEAPVLATDVAWDNHIRAV